MCEYLYEYIYVCMLALILYLNTKSMLSTTQTLTGILCSISPNVTHYYNLKTRLGDKSSNIRPIEKSQVLVVQTARLKVNLPSFLWPVLLSQELVSCKEGNGEIQEIWPAIASCGLCQ